MLIIKNINIYFYKMDDIIKIMYLDRFKKLKEKLYV